MRAVRLSIGSPLPAGVTPGRPPVTTVRITEGNAPGKSSWGWRRSESV